MIEFTILPVAAEEHKPNVAIDPVRTPLGTEIYTR